MSRLTIIISVIGIVFLLVAAEAFILPEVETFDFLQGINVTDISDILRTPHEDAYLSTPELIDKYGYNSETHTVATYDEYILEMHRITGSKSNLDPTGKPAVFLMHGILMSSADWIILGPGKSLGYILADAGYDVWIGNVRGNTYCRKHLCSITKKEFWNFSWHEIGLRDLPVMINYILDETGNEKLFYIGHSQGTTTFFTMVSQLPEYNDRIISMHALAPVAYCHHMKSPVLKFLSLIADQIWLVTQFFGIYELRLTQKLYDKFTSKVCDVDSPLQPLCSNLLFMITGFSPNQLNMTLLPTILGHVPAGASVRQALHYAQLMKSDKFRQFDHGSDNYIKYGSFAPPDYNLTRINIPVSLHYSVNDWLTHTTDVQRLYTELGNPIGKFRVPLNEFNHLDFLWAKDADKLLYENVLSLMSRFKDQLKEQ